MEPSQLRESSRSSKDLQQRQNYPSNCERSFNTVLLIIIGFIVALVVQWSLRVVPAEPPPQPAYRPVIVQSVDSNPMDRVNLASKFNGARVNPSQSSPQFHGILSYFASSSLAALLTDDNSPGHCWAFGGSSGYATIELPRKTVVSHFAMHYPSLADFHTAPRQVKVWGVDSHSKWLLAEHELQLDSSSPKRKLWHEFSCSQNCEKTASSLLLEVVTNYGGDFTCVYQLQAYE